MHRYLNLYWSMLFSYPFGTIKMMASKQTNILGLSKPDGLTDEVLKYGHCVSTLTPRPSGHAFG